MRNRLAAVLAAGALLMAVGAVAFGAAPTYSISVDKTASPTAVPPSGGTVTFSIIVDNTGTGHLAAVNVADSMVGCTVGAPSGDTDADTNLDANETWTYQCTVNNVTPGASNTATVNACHSAGVCNNSSHDAHGTDTVTLLEGPEPTTPPATQPPATEPPATEPPATQPPATEPPATEPPATEPPATEPPATQPPATEPPATEPPATQPPATEPPATEPPATEPPATQPPVSEVPATINPSQDAGGESDVPTVDPSQDLGGESDAPDASQPNTDTAVSATGSRGTDTTWMLVIALGMLLASILLATPSTKASRAGRER